MAEKEEEGEKKVKCEDCKPGAPLWMATFADMATLLMAFFVLILSFSDVKVDKYKAVVGSLINAFGMPKVQIIPMGTTVMPSDFSPSITRQTPINQLNQEVVDPEKDVPEEKQNPDSDDFDVQEEKRKLEQLLKTEITNAQVEVKLEGSKVVVELKGSGVLGPDSAESKDVQKAGIVSQERLGLVAKVSEAQQQIKAEVEVRQELQNKQLAESQLKTKSPKAQEELEEQLTREVAELNDTLKSEIEAGNVQIERRQDEVAILLAEKATFKDGGADISPEAVEALEDVRDTILSSKGKIVIAGHTDNMPIFESGRFSSNWDLSSARAAAVAHAMSSLLGVPMSRIEIEAHADTKPIADNSTEEGRQKNRRVEIRLKGA
jgi:chemotaxis protein MotB